MRATGSTFWLLSGATGWRTAYKEGLSESREQGIRLAADPNGLLALSSADGSLGRLGLPLGVTIDGEGNLLLLVDAQGGEADPRILRYNPEEKKFVTLPWVGGYGTEARLFSGPAQITALGHDLYVADTGNRRVQVFDLPSLALRYIWGAPTAAGWNPVDLAASRDGMYILDQQHSRVYYQRRGANQLKLALAWEGHTETKNWSRILIDREGRIYLLDVQPDQPPVLDIFTPGGKWVGHATDPGDVRDRFDPPAIYLDALGRFCLPASLARPCNRKIPPPHEHREQTLADCAQAGALFDRHGRPAKVEPDEPVGPALYQKAGVWAAGPLDSQIYQCAWHRIELDLGDLPYGSGLTVSSFTSAENLSAEQIEGLAPTTWQKCFTTVGQFVPPGDEDNFPDQLRPEFLVQSQGGQYLWLKAELRGDGFQSPVIQGARIHYPRESYLNELPAIFSADEESRWMLERYLSIVQTELEGLEAIIENMPRLFDPKSVPPGPFLAYLASWLALPLEHTWTEPQKRALLEATPQFYGRRGTPAVLRSFLRIYLQTMNPQAGEQDAYPVLIEGYRERAHFQLGAEDPGLPNRGKPLWGPSMVNRLQLDIHAREGEVRLVSTGDPQRDIFHYYAHRFRVFVPSAWIRTVEQESMLIRAVEAEKPAHTEYELCLIEPRMRVDVQSTVGVDTIIGAYPQARLTCRDDPDVPTRRPPRNRLGYDTILATRPAGGPAIQLSPGTRVGRDTLIN